MDLHVKMDYVICCLFLMGVVILTEGIQHQGNLNSHDPDIQCSMEILNKLTIHQGINPLSIICQQNICDTVEDELRLSGTYQLFSVSPNSMKNDLSHALKGINDRRKINVNIAVIGEEKMLTTLMEMVQNFDKVLNQHAYLKIKYSWILIPSIHYDDLSSSAGDISNLALIYSKMANQTCSGTISTNYFMGEEIRRFASVGEYEKETVKMKFELFPNRRFGLNGRHLEVSTMYWPYFMEQVMVDDQATYIGICSHVTRALSISLNFTYTIILPPDNQWGSPGPNNTWTGLVGQLHRREVEIVSAALTNMPPRRPVMDYSDIMFYMEHTVMLYKEPLQDDNIITVFMKPFHPLVWYLLMVAIFVTSFMQWMIVSLSPYYEVYNLGMDGLNSLTLNVWYTFGSFFHQGHIKTPKCISGRIVFIFWWLSVVLFTSAYMGNMMAFLTVVKTDPPFSTLEELVDQGEYMFGLQGGSGYEAMFATYDDPTLKKGWAKIHEYVDAGHNVISTDIQDHLDLVEKGKYAYIGDNGGAEEFRADKCGYGSIITPFIPAPYAIGLQKNSALLEDVNKILDYLHQSGLLILWERQIWPQPISCDAQGTRKLTLYHYQGILYMLVGGLGVSCLALSGEGIVNVFKEKLGGKKMSTTKEEDGTNDIETDIVKQ